MKAINRSKAIGVLMVLAVLGGAGTAVGVDALWTGGAGTDKWSDAGNWSTAPGYPCDGEGILYDVTISGPEANVILDHDDTDPIGTCMINRLELSGGATLTVHDLDPDSEPEMTLIIVSGGNVLISNLSPATPEERSLLQVLGGVTVDVGGEVHIAPGGGYQADPSAGAGEDSTLHAVTVVVDGGYLGGAAEGGQLTLKSQMSLLVDNDLVLDGSDPVPPSAGPAPMGGTTPPILKVYENATADVDGNMNMDGMADVTLGCTETATMRALQSTDAPPHYHLVLAGDFNNTITYPEYSSFDACDGGVLLNGTTGADPQAYPAFEVGSELRCDNPCEDNFGIGFLAVQAGAKVRFKDTVDNQPSGVDPELQYVRVVLFEPGSIVAVDGTGVVFDAITSGADVASLNDGFLSRLREVCPPPTPSSAAWAVVVAAIVLLVAGTLAIRRVRHAAA